MRNKSYLPELDVVDASSGIMVETTKRGKTEVLVGCV